MAAARVVVDRAEVALAVDQRVAHREVLRQAHERVVDRRVAVRVVVAHHLADDAGALRVAAASGRGRLVHRVEHAAVDRLEAVAHVGQRAADDHATSRSRGTTTSSRPRARAARCRRSARRRCHRRRRAIALDVEVDDVAGVVLDELAARLDLVAHQHREDLVGRGRVLDRHLLQRARAPGPSWSRAAARRSSRPGP